MIPGILAPLRIFSFLYLYPYTHFWEPYPLLTKGAYEGTIQNLLSLAPRLWE